MKKTKLFKNETEAYLYQWCEDALIIIQASEDLGADKANALAILLTRLLEKAFNLVPTRFTAELRTYVAEACSTITESNRDGIQMSWESQVNTAPNDDEHLKQEIIATTKRLLQTDDTEYCLEILNEPIPKSYSPTCTNLIIDILAELMAISKENSDIPDRLKRLWSYKMNITSLEFIQDYLQTYKQNDDKQTVNEDLLTIDTTIEASDKNKEKETKTHATNYHTLFNKVNVRIYKLKEFRENFIDGSPNRQTPKQWLLEELTELTEEKEKDNTSRIIIAFFETCYKFVFPFSKLDFDQLLPITRIQLILEIAYRYGIKL